MKITPILNNQNFYKQKQNNSRMTNNVNNVSFGRIPTHAFRVNPYLPPELHLSSPVQSSFPRMFSEQSFALVMSNYPNITQYQGDIIAHKVLSDIRKSQDEADYYARSAIQERKNAENSCADSAFYSTSYFNGIPTRETFLSDDKDDLDNGKKTRYICLYAGENISTRKVYKTVDGKVKKTYHADLFKDTGKINIVNFRDDGSVKDIAIGAKHHPDGSYKIDKYYTFSEKSAMQECAMNVVKKDDGTVEMTNYAKTVKNSVEYFDKYAGKRIINPDGTVTYKNILYFRCKDFWRFAPEKTFMPGCEHKKLNNKNYNDFDVK